MRHSRAAWYFDAHSTLGIGVVDAPMIGATGEVCGTQLEATPWVRVLRHENDGDARGLERDRVWALDIVHKDFFCRCFASHPRPFAHRFAAKVLAHRTELATGAAFAAGMGSDSFRSIAQRMRPRAVRHEISGGCAIGRRVLSLLSRRSSDH